MTAATAANNIFDQRVHDSLSQQLQNRAIDEANKGRWVLARVVTVVKPIALFIDIAKSILSAGYHFAGAIALNPFVWAANWIRDEPWNYPCSPTEGRQYVSLTVFFLMDLPFCLVINILSPTFYTRTESRQDIIDEMEVDLENAEIELEQVKQDKMEVEEKLGTAEATARGRQARIEALNEQIETLTEEKESAEQNLARVSQELSELRNQPNARAEALEDQVNELRAQLEALTQQKAAVDLQLAAAQTADSASKAQVEQLTQQAQALQGQIDTLAQEKADAAAAHASAIEAKDQQISALEVQLQQAQSAANQAGTAHQAAVEALKNAHQAELLTAQGNASDLASQIAELRAEIAAKEKVIQDQGAKNTAEIQQFQAEIQQLQGQLKTLTAEKQDVEAQCKQLQEQLDQASQKQPAGAPKPSMSRSSSADSLSSIPSAKPAADPIVPTVSSSSSSSTGSDSKNVTAYNMTFALVRKLQANTNANIKSKIDAILIHIPLDQLNVDDTAQLKAFGQIMLSQKRPFLETSDYQAYQKAINAL